jgi:hypothetical protein
MRWIILIILAISCADPKYINSELESRREQYESECALYFKEEQLCLTMKWNKLPSESEFGNFTMKFHEKGRPDILLTPKYTLQVVLWMPSMGHGSSPVTIEFVEEGIFKALSVYFIMPGPWDIRFQLKEGSRVVEQVIQKIII